jgi:hypothetical protein
LCWLIIYWLIAAAWGFREIYHNFSPSTLNIALGIRINDVKLSKKMKKKNSHIKIFHRVIRFYYWPDFTWFYLARFRFLLN